MRRIFINVCRHMPTLTLVSLLLIASGTPSTAQTFHRNGKIAFTSDRDGNFEIHTINPDGSDLVRLTNSAEAESYPTWSPDGRMIAFISQTPAGARAIFRMNEDGTNKVQITTTRSLAPLSWSPDGGRIAFQDQLNPDVADTDIFVVNIDGSKGRNLTADPYIPRGI
jgi:Tol biopolymer transport system component